MILKHPETNALLNIDNFESIAPGNDETSRIMMQSSQYEADVSVEDLFEWIKSGRQFAISSWKLILSF